MAEEGAGRGRQREFVRETTVFGAVVGIDQQHRERALEHIAGKRRGGETLAAGGQPRGAGWAAGGARKFAGSGWRGCRGSGRAASESIRTGSSRRDSRTI